MDSNESLEEFRRRARLHVEAINHATRDIPADEMRIHLCWGNYEGPHHHDLPLRDIIDIVFEARPAAISFEADPELVAQRITRYAQLVGRENVIAGSDCGFATFASFLAIDPGITWAKLGAMAERARIASSSLW